MGVAHAQVLTELSFRGLLEAITCSEERSVGVLQAETVAPDSSILAGRSSILRGERRLPLTP
jgi:hypothetical protein